MLKEGDTVPKFNFFLNGKNKNIDTFKGVVVLYFYPRDNTPGCTIEAKNFNNKAKELAALNTIVVGISGDNEKSHEKFSNKYNLNFPLIADVDKSIIKAFGCLVEKSMFGKKYMGISRSTFIIKNKKIIKVFEKVKILTHADDVIKYLTANAQ